MPGQHPYCAAGLVAYIQNRLFILLQDRHKPGQKWAVREGFGVNQGQACGGLDNLDTQSFKKYLVRALEEWFLRILWQRGFHTLINYYAG